MADNGEFGGETARRQLDLADETATEALARLLAGVARRGDVVGLTGGLGAGQTTFARAFIRARGGTDAVPSPTFTLVQMYDLPDGEIWHFDLYRLARAEDARELGVEEAFDQAISLIEWPERMAPLLPPDRLEIAFEFGDDADSRQVRLIGHGGWSRRLAALTVDV